MHQYLVLDEFLKGKMLTMILEKTNIPQNTNSIKQNKPENFEERLKKLCINHVEPYDAVNQVRNK